MNADELRAWFKENREPDATDPPEDIYSDNKDDENYLCPPGRVARGLPAFKEKK